MSSLTSSSVPATRIRVLWDREPRARGRYVLYWMNAARRTRDNFALDRAIELARVLQRPLLVLEALRVDYPFASDRLHRFVLDGMAANRRAFAASPVGYHPYVEPSRGAGKGLLRELAARACAVVTDDFPCFFLPAMVAASRLEVDTRYEAVDSNGLLPMRGIGRRFLRAFDFRRYLQRELPAHLPAMPRAEPLADLELAPLGPLPGALLARWPAATDELLEGDPGALAALPIDHSVRVVSERGGAEAAQRRLEEFLELRLPRYAEDRNRIEDGPASGLSPHLHFGHVAPQRVFARVAAAEGWTPARLGTQASGKREGWWGMGAAAEAFLDQLVTWRELGLNACVEDPTGYASFESLPDWVRTTLAEHADDPREPTYDLKQFEAAETHDPLWNAAQRELRTDGRIHNYLRMLWGKKILHWSRSPREALAIMLELNDRYAIDGRDPNSYSGILWVLGKYDRAWGPERPVFGKVRYMTSDSTRRKMNVKGYLARWSGETPLLAGLEFDAPEAPEA